MLGSSDSLFGSGGIFGGAAGTQQKEFGSSTATATIEGDTVGLQLDWRMLAAIGLTAIAVVLAGVWLVSILVRK